MEFNNFCVSSMKIKSLWFGEKKTDNSIYKQIKKEEGLNLYIQLFRFRYHQIIYEDTYKDYQYHVFRITLAELIKYTKVNKKRRLPYSKLIELLQLLEEFKVIKNHTIDDWDTFDIDKDKHKLIVLEATDVPKTEQIKGKDEPITKPDDIYITINFKTINYIYKTLKLSSRELSLYLLLMRLSNGGEKKSWARIETMADWLGVSKDTISAMLIKLNEGNLIATYIKDNGLKGIKFEHSVLKSYKVLESFKKDHEPAINRFLKRKIKSEEVKNENIHNESDNVPQPKIDTENPFMNLDNNAVSEESETDDLSWLDDTDEDDWGQSPNGYDDKTGSDDIDNDENNPFMAS